MRLPTPRGPLSSAVVTGLRTGEFTHVPEVTSPDPISDDDVQLALWTLYELHYRGFDDVSDELEWDAGALRLRAELEKAFLHALRSSVSVPTADDTPIAEALTDLVDADDGPSLSRYLERKATRSEFEEFLVHRSIYHLKEADPHSWVIPRLSGRAKAALIAVQSDEYGNGITERMHAELFRRMLRETGLDDSYGAYVDCVPGITFALTNLITLFGLHRALRGSLVGHLAAFEMTSSVPNRRYGKGLRRLGGSGDARRFFDEHVTADALHEQLAAHELCGGLVAESPELAQDVLFGAAACLHLDAVFTDRVLGRWSAGSSSLYEEESQPVAS